MDIPQKVPNRPIAVSKVRTKDQELGELNDLRQKDITEEQSDCIDLGLRAIKFLVQPLQVNARHRCDRLLSVVNGCYKVAHLMILDLLPDKPVSFRKFAKDESVCKFLSRAVK